MGEALALRNVDLNEFAIMNGQLDGAKAQRVKGIEHGAHCLGKRCRHRLSVQILIGIGHWHPLWNEQIMPLRLAQMSKLNQFN